MLIDTHCHLNFPDFQEDLASVLLRAQQAHIKKMITISTKLHEFPQLLALAEKYKEIYCSIGLHPCQVQTEKDCCVDQLLQYQNHPKLVAIGETGLDYYHDRSTEKAQKDIFLKHIEAARQSGLPLVIHTRAADDDMANILQAEIKNGQFSFILHCFSSSEALARVGLDLGGYISFSGIVTFKNAQNLRDIATFIPHDRLLVETDAPYLAPVPYRGKRNEPAYVAETAKFLADYLKIDFAKFAAQTTENAMRLFSKL